jgi:hypothetical protein
MSEKRKPSLDLDTGVDLELDQIDEHEALFILRQLGCKRPNSNDFQLIHYTVARIRADMDVGQRRPSAADQAETLGRLQTQLLKLDLLGAIGPKQRAMVMDRLNRWSMPPPVSSAFECLSYLRDALAVWDIEARERKLSVPRALQVSFRKSLNLLTRMNEYSEMALSNWLAIELEHAEPLPASADHVDALEYCRRQILKALERALERPSKRGRPPA